MYYNRILDRWVLDAVDYFLLSALVTKILTPHVTDYFSEEASMERLKNSIIRKSKSKRVDLNSKEAKIKKIYRFALNNRGGQMEFASDYEVAEKIRDIVLRLAAFLKQPELKGILKIIFAQGRLILELILCTCKIQLDYVVVGELNPQVIVIAITTGGVTGLTLSWIGAGGMLISGPTILTAFLLRSLNQQVKHFHQVAELKETCLH